MSASARITDAYADGLEGTRSLLVQWGRWVWHGYPGPLGNRSLLGELLRRSGEWIEEGRMPSPDIDDDTALEIERALAALRDRHRRIAQAVVIYYSRPNMSHQRLAGVLRTSKKSAQDLLSAGEHWIDAMLHGEPRL